VKEFGNIYDKDITNDMTNINYDVYLLKEKRLEKEH
jgi:hypothetical protein